MNDPGFVMMVILVAFVALMRYLVMPVGTYLSRYLVIFTMYTTVPAKTITRRDKSQWYPRAIAPRYLVLENKRLRQIIEDKNKQLEQQAKGKIKRESNRQMSFLPGVPNSNGQRPVVPWQVDGKMYWLIFENQNSLTRFTNPEEWIWVAREVRVGKHGSRWEALWAKHPEKEPTKNDDPLDDMYYDYRYDVPLINKIPPTHYNSKAKKEEYIDDRWLPFTWKVEEIPQDAPQHTFSASGYIDTRKKALKNGR